MGFYEELSKYYDIVFPLGNSQLNFIKNRADGKVKILDLAAGTGNYSIAMAKMGYSVTAVDLDKEMVNRIKEKNCEEGTNVNAMVMDMNSVDSIKEKFDLIICIGNSLVHLDNKEDINNLITKLYKLLNENGILIIQIVNYDRIIEKDIKELPLIQRQDKGVTFVRNYERENDKILFKTKILVENNKEEKIYYNTVELYPLKSEDLKLMLKEAGFNKVEMYGDFNGGDYNIESMATVVAAYK